jgi:hypothetical protein
MGIIILKADIGFYILCTFDKNYIHEDYENG